MLASSFARVLVRVYDGRESVEEFALSVPHGSTVGDVLAAYKINDAGIAVPTTPDDGAVNDSAVVAFRTTAVTVVSGVNGSHSDEEPLLAPSPS